jgi:hypothetical protein
LNGTHQLLVSGDDVNILDENINNIKKNPEALLETKHRDDEGNAYVLLPEYRTKSQFIDR